MNIYHSYFKFWRNYPDKIRFTWVAITKTVPQDYIGCIYKRLAPIGEEFDKTIEPTFNEKAFFKVYADMLKRLDRKEIINEIKEFSRKGKDIVLLNWEDMTRQSEGRFAYAWMFQMSIDEANKNNLENILAKEKITASLTGLNFLEI